MRRKNSQHGLRREVERDGVRLQIRFPQREDVRWPDMMAGHATAREAKLAKLLQAEREKKRADMEKRRNKAREKCRVKHGITHRVLRQKGSDDLHLLA